MLTKDFRCFAYPFELSEKDDKTLGSTIPFKLSGISIFMAKSKKQKAIYKSL